MLLARKEVIPLKNNFMNIFKKIIVGLVALFAIMAPVSNVLAITNYGLDTAANKAGLQKNIQGETDPLGIVGLVVKAGLSLVGLVFFGLMLYAGVTWMTARGDSGKVDKAKDTMESAIIGLVIVVSAYAIVNFVFSNVVSNSAVSSGGNSESGVSFNANGTVNYEGKDYKTCTDNSGCDPDKNCKKQPSLDNIGVCL